MEAELTLRPPIDSGALLDFFARRAVPGVEQVEGGTYRRSLALPGGPATLELTPGDDMVGARFDLADAVDRPAAEAAARALLDLDAAPDAIGRALEGDELVGPLARANPGRRLAGHSDPGELAIRAVIGQQVSVAAARTVAGRLVAAHGEPLPRPLGGVTHLFPAPAALAAVDPAALPMPRARGRALVGLAAALADGDLRLSPADPAGSRDALLARPGIGPWTAEYVAMRALGDRDAFLPTDLGVRHALERLGADGSPRAAEARAEAWRPFRAYALQHLWTTLDQGGTR